MQLQPYLFFDGKGEDAIEFYKKTVGWTTQAFDPEGKYVMWANQSGPVGGIGPAGDDAVSRTTPTAHQIA